MIADLSVYPNPATDLLNLQINQTYEKGEYRLYDQTGKLVLSNQLTGVQEQQIQVMNLARGSYFLEIKVDETQISKSVILQ